ncbi:MAG: CDP-glycerol glycerophosphotransferase family protein, partial [Candidatus Hermodarchaeota archaeon]
MKKKWIGKSMLTNVLIKKLKPMRLAKFLRINTQFFFDVVCYHFSRLFKANVDDKLIVLGGANGKSFMGNTKYLYKYLKKNTNYKLVWIYKSHELGKELEKQGIKTIYKYSLEALKTLRRARAIFVTHGYSDILPIKLAPRTKKDLDKFKEYKNETYDEV